MTTLEVLWWRSVRCTVRTVRCTGGVCLSGNALDSLNQRWARLVLGWVTVCGRVNHLGMQPATQVNSAFHPSTVG